MARRLEEWRGQRRKNKELEEEQKLAEEIQKRRQAKVTCVDTCVIQVICWCKHSPSNDASVRKSGGAS